MAVGWTALWACAATATDWPVKRNWFCPAYDGVTDSRLHKNVTVEECQSMCEKTACPGFSYTNARVPELKWCFLPLSSCSNPNAPQVPHDANWDTFTNPSYSPPPFTLSQTLTSHMVLQMEPAQARLWGWGVPGMILQLEITDSALNATVGPDGRWNLHIPPQKAGAAFGTGNLVLASGDHKVVLKDVLFGEVWLCTGQSNMGVSLSGVGKGKLANQPLTSWSGDVSFGKDEIANASAYPLLRVVQQQSVSLPQPTEHASAGQGWFIPSRINIGGFSAVCWMYGRRLQTHLGIPVGLIENQVGGTAVERWSSADALGKCDQRRGDRMALCKARSAEQEDGIKAAMRAEGGRGGDAAVDPSTGVNSTLFNGMIAPWAGTAVRGAVWYQGESNVACSDVWPYMQGSNCAMGAADCADYYACQLPAMIDDWRARFANPAPAMPPLTFLFVGLPAYVQDLPSTNYDQKVDASLPLLRLAQANASASQPHTFMTSLIDHGYLYGHIGSIHPMDKTPVGKRLFLAARQHAYQEPGVVSTGPAPLSAKLSVATSGAGADAGVAAASIALAFDPATVGPSGLLLRTSGSTRQLCMVGQTQTSGNPVGVQVPASQCGPATGFSVSDASGLAWHDVTDVVLAPDKKSLTLSVPAAALSTTANVGAGTRKLRYLFADWPTPTVYNSQSFLGVNGELPTPPFEIEVQA